MISTPLSVARVVTDLKRQRQFFVSSVALGFINTSQDHNKGKWVQSDLVQVSIFWKNYLKFPINLFK